MPDTIKALAASMVARKQAGLEPYVLFIGAGASISSGCSSMLRIVDDVLQKYDAAKFEAWQKEIADATSKDERFGNLLRNEINDKKLENFLESWAAFDSETRYAILRKHLWEGKTPSEGYVDLAHLVKAEYFNLILSTNLDNLMEKALNNIGLLSPENFIVIVNRKDSLEEIMDQLENPRAPVKLVKLHGTLESPLSYAFTVEELFNFEKAIKPSLSRIINRSLLVVGHSMQDRDIHVLFDEEGKEVHFVNPARPKLGSAIDNVLKVRSQGSIIDGAEGTFDTFFRQLRGHIETESNEAATGSPSTSIEEFLKSIGYESELKVPRSRYKNLQTLYVKPTEYDDIITKLEKDRILFIIGEPHMGKTYTALYLLWEYYQKDYDTVHIRHDQLISQLHRHDGNLKALLVELFTPVSQRPRIVHFDDPFGETLERRTEALSNGLGTFLELASGYEHLRVVVTSRLNIFNEAINESGIQGDLEELEKTLRVHTSYRHDVLLDILHRYMRFYKPVWVNDARIAGEIDKKLPAMLAAPHNIEFFVRTSETLNTLDAVLSHVEESKMMVSALAGWMKHMPPHEQVFLMWIEVGSTASILFPNIDSSEIDIEKAYRGNLAYLFKEGHISSIPPMPFSSARDKFETILLERRDEKEGTIKLDFVHPSYHEAFWYTVSRRFPTAQWWELLNRHLREILGDLGVGIDVVWLKMIERYGTINRDLDQLLLLSAESEDVNEQLIALGHMLERPEQFAMLPQFARCMHSVISQGDDSVKIGFLNLYDKYFNKLPLDMLSVGPSLIFDEFGEVRLKAQEIILMRMDELPESIRQGEALKKFEVLSKLLFDTFDPYGDWLRRITYGKYDRMQRAKLDYNFVNLAPAEIHQLIQTPNNDFLSYIFQMADRAWDRLSRKQRESMIPADFFEVETALQVEVEKFVAKHLADLAYLSGRYPFIQVLMRFSQAFNITLKGNIISQFESIPVEQWPQLSPSSLRELVSTFAANLGAIITTRILENYDQILPGYRDIYLESLFSPKSVQPFINYIDRDGPQLKNISGNVLIKLLNVPGIVQYKVLSALLIRFHLLDKEAQQVVKNLIYNPPDRWVGGSVGQIAMRKYSQKISKEVEDFPLRVVELQQKPVTGALLSEMAQIYLDASMGLQEQYESTFLSLVTDSEIVQHAEDWMDHQFSSYGFYDENYWSDIKARMRNLSKGIS